MTTRRHKHSDLQIAQKKSRSTHHTPQRARMCPQVTHACGDRLDVVSHPRDPSSAPLLPTQGVTAATPQAEPGCSSPAPTGTLRAERQKWDEHSQLSVCGAGDTRMSPRTCPQRRLKAFLLDVVCGDPQQPPSPPCPCTPTSSKPWWDSQEHDEQFAGSSPVVVCVEAAASGEGFFLHIYLPSTS